MRPIEFPEQNVVYGEGMEEYEPLPACKNPDGEMVCCWRVGLRERLKLLFTGKIWVQTLTFNGPLQPMYIGADYPFQPPEAP